MRLFEKMVFRLFVGACIALGYFCEKTSRMRTKYFLEIDGNKHEIPQRCVKNWGEVKCAYKRADYSGVTRSFTTQFEFVDEAYDLLFNLYIRDGLSAEAKMYLYTITNSWEWEERFSAPVDFSSLTWDGYVLRVNCIDNSLAALIKSKLGTKYEFVIGEEIPVSERLVYDRLEMSNSVCHEVMGNGDSSHYGDETVAIVPSDNLKRLPTYAIGSAETYENSPVVYDDESDQDGSYFIRIENPVISLNLDIELNYYGDRQPPFGTTVTNMEIHLMKFDSVNSNIDSTYTDLGTIFKVSDSDTRQCLGCFASFAALQAQYPNPPQDVFAIIGSSNNASDCEAVYFTPVTKGVETQWILGRRSTYTEGPRGSALLVTCLERRFISRFDLSSYERGSRFALAYKCSMNRSQSSLTRELNFGLGRSKIKTSWVSRAKKIEIDALTPESVLKALMTKLSDGKMNVGCHIDASDQRIAKTYILAAESIRNIPGAKFFSSFDEFRNWMEAVFGYGYYIEGNDIYFVPRSSLYGTQPVIEITNVNDFQYSIAKELIFSTVIAGYDKQYYGTECGRDEWNFSAQYTAGLELSSKKLELISKYRADCYGLEFVAQKRSQDTTDDKSDSTVFFVHCKIEITAESDGEEVIEKRQLVLDRSVQISGALSATVFNGEYAPYRCILANGNFIGAVKKPLTLKFASFDGNSEVIINGVAGNSDLTISDQIFTAGEIEFSTEDLNTAIDPMALYKVVFNGITYYGYLSDADVKFARNEAIKMKLIVKEVSE